MHNFQLLTLNWFDSLLLDPTLCSIHGCYIDAVDIVVLWYPLDCIWRHFVPHLEVSGYISNINCIWRHFVPHLEVSDYLWYIKCIQPYGIRETHTDSDIQCVVYTLPIRTDDWAQWYCVGICVWMVVWSHSSCTYSSCHPIIDAAWTILDVFNFYVWHLMPRYGIIETRCGACPVEWQKLVTAA